MDLSSFSIALPKPKESYAFIFSSMIDADFWLKQTSLKLHSQIIFRNKRTHRIEFEDCTYYFLSESQVSDIRGAKFDNVYSGDAIYIILDDPERLRIKKDDLMKADTEENTSMKS